MGSLYETDFVAWSAKQASVLRDAGKRRVNAPVDWENVAEEIESLGRSERRELRGRIGTIIEHLLKLHPSPADHPANAWSDTIERTRGEVADILADSPSLRREVAGIIAEQLATTRHPVAGSLARRGETPRQPLEAITYVKAQLLHDWLPDRPPPAA